MEIYEISVSLKVPSKTTLSLRLYHYVIYLPENLSRHIVFCYSWQMASRFSQTNKQTKPRKRQIPPPYYLSAGSTGILLFPRLLYKDIIRIDVTLSDDKFRDYLSVFVTAPDNAQV